MPHPVHMLKMATPYRIKCGYWSLRADTEALYALLMDPAYSISYYPEDKRKPKVVIAAELLWWWLRFREVNRFYYLYGLDRADADARSVMPRRRFRAMRDAANSRPPNLARYYRNAYNYVCVLRDKMLFSQVAASLDVPVAKSLAVCSPTSVRWIDTGRSVPIEELASDTALCIDSICKPVDGIMGQDLFRLQIEHGRLFIDQAEATLDMLKARLSARHLLQAPIIQHPALARLHPESINTLRLVTFNTEGRVTLFWAALRVGASGRSTDNWAAGGVLVAVDPEAGVLRGDGYLKPAFGNRVRRHPDTGILFDGFEIPLYQQAVDLACRLHDYLPGLHSIGWDIAITPDGPVFIEGNDDWDGVIAMVLEPDFRRKFTAMF